MAQSSDNVPESLRGIQALTCDVFGTVVNWRATVTAELIRRAQEKTEASSFSSLAEPLQKRLASLKDEDWARFAQDWRNSYGKFTQSFVPGVTAWKDIDTHHHDSLIELLQQWQLDGLYTAEEIKSLSLIWHYLAPWPDSSAGIKKLGTKLYTATLSNGNQELLTDLNKHGDLGFRQLISSADFGAYKPNPKTYLGAVGVLGCQPKEVAMVAAHLGDLYFARSNGLRTIYIERDQEESWGKDEEQYLEAKNWVDLWITVEEEGFVEVARRLGIE